MGEPFLGEIKMISWNFPPQGWAFCNGQFLPINQNQALFSLMGTTYGGNGQTTFALPDLRGKIPLHRGDGFTQGQVGGENAHTITTSELPTHTHFINAKAPVDGSGNSNVPTGRFFSNSAPNELYASGGGSPGLLVHSAGTISNTGGSQPHQNLQPYIVINYIVALIGIFPSRN